MSNTTKKVPHPTMRGWTTREDLTLGEQIRERRKLALKETLQRRRAEDLRKDREARDRQRFQAQHRKRALERGQERLDSLVETYLGDPAEHDGELDDARRGEAQRALVQMVHDSSPLFLKFGGVEGSPEHCPASIAAELVERWVAENPDQGAKVLAAVIAERDAVLDAMPDLAT